MCISSITGREQYPHMDQAEFNKKRSDAFSDLKGSEGWAAYNTSIDRRRKQDHELDLLIKQLIRTVSLG